MRHETARHPPDRHLDRCASRRCREARSRNVGLVMNLIDFFDRGALHYPDRDCFVAADRSYTYREIRELTLRLANGLRSLGFRAGAKGAVLSINDPVAFSCALAILRAGGAWVPINPKNALDEHVHMLSQFDCEVRFYHSQLRA